MLLYCTDHKINQLAELNFILIMRKVLRFLQILSIFTTIKLLRLKLEKLNWEVNKKSGSANESSEKTTIDQLQVLKEASENVHF